VADYIKMKSGDRLRLTCSFKHDSLSLIKSESGRIGCPISFVDESGNKLCLWMSEKFDGTQDLIDELNKFEKGDLVILSFGVDGYSVDLDGGDVTEKAEEDPLVDDSKDDKHVEAQQYNPTVVAPIIKRETKSSSMLCSKDLVVSGHIQFDEMFKTAVLIEEFVKTNKHENIAKILDHYGSQPEDIETASKDIGERTGIFFNMDKYNKECFYDLLIKYSAKHVHDIILMIKGIL